MLEPVVAELAAAVAEAPSAHIDETSWTEATEKTWLWVGLTDEVTVFIIADNRGADMARSILGTDREKIVSSDRYASYDWIAERQFCWSHLRRDFQAMIDRQDEGSVIGERNCLGPRIGCSTGGTRSRWDHRLEYIPGLVRPLQWAVRQVLGRGTSCVRSKTAGTCRELLAGEAHLWTFVRVRGIEPTNNSAERALRHAVLWRKSSGATASEWGNRFVERVRSVAATCRQQGRNVLEYLTVCFQARLAGDPLPSLLTQHAVIIQI
jgi:transposase